MSAAERAWYWAAGVLEGVGHGNTTAFVHAGRVTCERWERYDQRWYAVTRPLSDFEDPREYEEIGDGYCQPFPGGRRYYGG